MIITVQYFAGSFLTGSYLAGSNGFFFVQKVWLGRHDQIHIDSTQKLQERSLSQLGARFLCGSRYVRRHQNLTASLHTDWGESLISCFLCRKSESDEKESTGHWGGSHGCVNNTSSTFRVSLLGIFAMQKTASEREFYCNCSVICILIG